MCNHSKQFTHSLVIFMTEHFAKSLIKMVPKWIHYYVYHRNELILYVYPEFLIPFLSFLRDHMNTQDASGGWAHMQQ